MKKLPKLRTNAQNHKNAPTSGKRGFFSDQRRVLNSTGHDYCWLSDLMKRLSAPSNEPANLIKNLLYVHVRYSKNYEATEI